MRVAYEAADASHPKGKCWLAARKGTSPDRALDGILLAAIIFIGKETPEKGAGRTITFLSTGWSSSFRL
jgi:hypothetical protein